MHMKRARNLMVSYVDVQLGKMEQEFIPNQEQNKRENGCRRMVRKTLSD